MAGARQANGSEQRRKRRLLLPDLSVNPVQQVRASQRGGGPTALMQGRWRDPHDTSPTAAKYARQVSGWQTYCPLRRMASGKSSNITEAHIYAANKLRESADAAGIGFSAERDGLPVTSIIYGPKLGPSKAAQASERAARDFRRATRIFTDSQLLLIDGIILKNWAVERWCKLENDRTGKRMDPKIELGKLIGILDQLVDYYKTDIEQDLASGRVLPAITD